MKNTFTYESKYGAYEDCVFQSGVYANKNLGIEIWSNTEGPVTKVTINPDISLPHDRIAIKDYAENEGMVDWLISQNLIEEDPIQIIMTGRVEIPVHMLTEEGKKAFLPQW